MTRTLRPLLLALGLVAATYGVLGIGSARAVADPISIGSMSRGVGATGTVKLQAHDISFPELGAWQIDITYNQAIIDAMSCTNLAGTASCNYNYATNKVRLVGSSTNGLTGATIDLATLGFQCLAPGTSSLTLTVDVLADPDGDPVPHSIQNGSVICSQFVGGIARMADVDPGALQVENSASWKWKVNAMLGVAGAILALTAPIWIFSRRCRVG
jgi:hypothetical protein